MYIWNKTSLIKDLKKWIPESEDIKYLLVSTLLISLVLLVTTPMNNRYDYVLWFLGIVYPIAMTYYLYKINIGWNFLSRFLAIWVVALCRSIVFFLIPFLVVLIVIYTVQYGENIPEITTIYDVIFVISYMIGATYLSVTYFRELQK